MKGYVYLFILLLPNCVFSQSIQLADKAYAHWNYQTAASQYEQFLFSSEGKKSRPEKIDSIKLRLADCYWQMRAYEQSNYWYGQLPELYKQTSELQKRLGELSAMYGNYGKAVQYFSRLNGWDKKAKGFSKTDFMNRDSADWEIGYVKLDEKSYREFSPMLVDSMLYWTTNERKREWIPKTMGWDGYRYTHILAAPDTFQVLPDMPNRKSWDSSQYLLLTQQRKNAIQYVNADNAHLRSISGISANKLSRKKGFSPLSLNGTNGLQYNVAHTSYSPKTKKIYLNVNKSFIGRDGSRLIGIVEGDIADGVVYNLKSIQLVDTAYSALHPAIHPNGDLLVFSSNIPGGYGGYDLYYSKRLEEGSWSSPILLKSLSTVGDDLFARFTPQGDLIFSSDGFAGLGGLDLYKVNVFNSYDPEILHFPYPINSSYDDFGWTVTMDGTKGYFSSDRLGDDDIFQFTYTPKFSTIDGLIRSREDTTPQAGATVQLIEQDIDGNWKTVAEKITDKTGEYLFKIKPNHPYKISVQFENEAQKELAIMLPVGKNLHAEDIFSGKEKEKEVFVEPNIKLTADDDSSWKEEMMNHPINDVDRSNGSIYKGELAKWMSSADRVFIVHHEFDKVNIIKRDKHVLKEVEALLNSTENYELLIVSAADCMASEVYNNRLSNKRSISLEQLFKKKTSRNIKRFWVSERNLIVPCSTANFSISKQIENRYSYLILHKN